MALEELDPRQMVLGGVALLLILVHMAFPAAGVDAVSIILLLFLSVVLYGDEATAWLARQQERRIEAARPEPASDLSAKISQIGYQVEHARVAAATEGLPAGRGPGDELERIIERAQGDARPALLLAWGALEDRLRVSSGARDAAAAAESLVERGRLPRQFADALDSFRSLRNDVARSAGNGDVDDTVLWSLVDIAAGLLALVPPPERSRQGEMTL